VPVIDFDCSFEVICVLLWNMKTAVVTGGASGLGLEFAKLLARDAYDLLLLDVNGPELGNARNMLVQEYSVNVETIEEDLSRPGIIPSVYERLKNRKIDILIHNAGIGLRGFFTNTSWEREEAMIHLHVVTPTYLTKLIVKDMIHRGSGRILLISSLGGLAHSPLITVYCATKSYLLAFGIALASELKGTGVTLTCACPGNIRTRFQERTAAYSGTKLLKFGFFTSEPDMVALRAYRAMMSGKTFLVPGLKNKFLAGLCRVLPLTTVASIMKSILRRSIPDSTERIGPEPGI